MFNPSERFIQDQADALTRWRPVAVGLERTGEILPRLGENMILPESAGERLALRLGLRTGPMAARLRAAGARLIHAHFGPDGLIALPLARALDVPLITSLRGYDVTRSDAALLRSRHPSWIRYALLKRRLQREGALFLAVSDALRLRAIARGYPAERTRTHYNGVDLDRFRPGDAREPGLILHVARLVEKKGTRLLIEAAAGLDRARLVVIGDGPLRRELERRAAGADVTFLGALPPPEVAQWMRRAAILAAPSLTARDGDAEGLPNVVVEAAASCLPVVATRHSGIPEAVEDRVTGFLVPEGDPAALTSALAAALIAGPGMGAAARALAEARFDRRRQTERLEAIYDEVAGFRPGAPPHKPARHEVDLL